MHDEYSYNFTYVTWKLIIPYSASNGITCYGLGFKYGLHSHLGVQLTFVVLIGPLIKTRLSKYEFEMWVKVQFRGPELYKKKGALFREESYLPGILCLREQVGDTFVNGWPLFECNFNVFAYMILPYGSHCIDMTPSPERINGAIGTWLSCFATCDWLRALVHLHCDVIITTSTTKTWWSCRSLGVDLPCFSEENLPSKYNVTDMKRVNWTINQNTTFKIWMWNVGKSAV